MFDFRSSALSVEEMVFATLHFLATGAFLRVAGEIEGLDQSTVSRTIDKVLSAIVTMRQEYIEMPTGDEIETIRQEFFNIARFPRCIGAIDCTHVRIRPASGGIDETFRNRKGFFSYNVQVLCDANNIIRNIVARWQGSAHDATIFANSRLRFRLENEEFGRESLIVGDAGYGIRNYLITPLANPRTAAENLFNESQTRTRNVIERTFGIWKRRFPVLALGIRLHATKIQKVIVATAILHNIACQMRDVVPAVDQEIEAAINLMNNVNGQYIGNIQNNINVNNVTRQVLINNYFHNLL